MTAPTDEVEAVAEAIWNNTLATLMDNYFTKVSPETKERMRSDARAGIAALDAVRAQHADYSDEISASDLDALGDLVKGELAGEEWEPAKDLVPGDWRAGRIASAITAAYERGLMANIQTAHEAEAMVRIGQRWLDDNG